MPSIVVSRSCWSGQLAGVEPLSLAFFLCFVETSFNLYVLLISSRFDRLAIVSSRNSSGVPSTELARCCATSSSPFEQILMISRLVVCSEIPNLRKDSAILKAEDEMLATKYRHRRLERRTNVIIWAHGEDNLGMYITSPQPCLSGIICCTKDGSKNMSG